LGKRGPKPRAGYAGKGEILSMRVKAETKAALLAAAKSAGRSLSQEVQLRLEWTLLEKRRIEERFGSREIYGLMRLIALAMHEAGTTAGFWATYTIEGANRWLDNPYAYSQARKVVTRVLDAFKPPGKILLPKQIRKDPHLKRIAQNVGTGFADSALQNTAWDEETTTADMAERGRLRMALGDHLTSRLKANVPGRDDIKTAKGPKK
jgi:hypothetical protein